MSYNIIASSYFIKSSKKYISKQKITSDDLKLTLEEMKENPYSSILKTHKLKGKLSGSYACSINYSIRIVFSFCQYQGHDAILLESIGTNDEVY